MASPHCHVKPLNVHANFENKIKKGKTETRIGKRRNRTRILLQRRMTARWRLETVADPLDGQGKEVMIRHGREV